MEYSMLNEANRILIALEGAFTFSDRNAFRSMLETLENTSAPTIVMDFGQVGFIDSAALGMLLLLREELGKEKSIALRHAQGQVSKMFTLSKFAGLFAIEE